MPFIFMSENLLKGVLQFTIESHNPNVLLSPYIDMQVLTRHSTSINTKYSIFKCRL